MDAKDAKKKTNVSTSTATTAKPHEASPAGHLLDLSAYYEAVAKMPCRGCTIVGHWELVRTGDIVRRVKCTCCGFNDKVPKLAPKANA